MYQHIENSQNGRSQTRMGAVWSLSKLAVQLVRIVFGRLGTALRPKLGEYELIPVSAFIFMSLLFAAAQAQAQTYDLLVDIDDVFTIGTPPNEVVVDSTALPAGAIAQLKFRVSNAGPAASVPTTLDIVATGSVSGQISLVAQQGDITNCVLIDVAGVETVRCDVPALAEPVESPPGSGVYPATFAEVILDFQTTVAETIQFFAVVATGPNEDPSTISNNDLSETITVTAGVDIDVEWIVGGVNPSAPVIVAAGDYFDYTVRVRNIGPDTADSYRLTVPVPPGLRDITPPSGCNLVVQSGQENFVCDVTTALAPADGTGNPFVDFVFNAQVAVASGSDITNSVTADNASPLDPNPTNDDDVFLISVASGADVAITKTRTPNSNLLYLGDVVTWTISTNYVGDAPTSILVEDTVPAEYQILSVNPGGYNCGLAPYFSGQQVSCTNSGNGTGPGVDGSYSYGDIVITAEVVAPTSSNTPNTISNTATVTAFGVTETTLSNNSASDGDVVLQAPFVDLAVTKSAPQTPAIQGVSGYRFTINVRNVGTYPYAGVVTVTDSLPAGVTLNAAWGNGWTCDAFAPDGTLVPTLPADSPLDVVCSRDYSTGTPLNPGSSTPNLFVTVTSNTVGISNNTATVDGASAGPGNDPSNDLVMIDFETVPPSESADVFVTKTSGVPTQDPGTGLYSLTGVTTATAGEPYAFEFVLGNNGPADSVDVRLLDRIFNLQDGRTDFIAIQTRNFAAGDTCVQDGRQGNSARLNCLVDIPANCVPGASCPSVIVVVVPGRDAGRDGGTRNNTASLTPLVTPDPDNSNNTSSVDFRFEPRSDVTIFKSAPLTIGTGVDLLYTITAQNLNNGLSRADDVTITDTLPDGLRFISAAPATTGSCSVTPVPGSTTGPGNNTVICNVGDLNLGVSRDVNIVVRPNFELYNQTPGAETTIFNQARVDLFDVTGSVITDPYDFNPDNNTDSTVTTLAPPDLDLLIEKFDSADPLAVGDAFTYTVEVQNLGPSAAHNVAVRDFWPAGSQVDFVSVAPFAEGSCTPDVAGPQPGQITCDIGYMEAGARVAIVINAIARSAGTVTNTVEVDASEIIYPSETGNNYDREAGNNSTVEETTIIPRTDVILQSKVASEPTVNVGDPFFYTATVTVSDAFGESLNTVLSDTLPANMELTGTPSATLTLAGQPSGAVIPGSCTGAAGDGSFQCALGTLFPNDVVAVIIPVRVTAVDALPDVFVNTATVTTTSVERGTARDNNVAAGPVAVVSSAISGNVFRDFADDVTKAPTDTDVAGVPVTLTGIVDGQPITPVTVLTDADGNFLFPLLAEGVYTVTRGDPGEAYLTDGTNTAGAVGAGASTGTVVGNAITLIPLGDNEVHADNIFRLIPQARIGLAKTGVIDVQNIDGSFDATYSFVIENFSLETLRDITLSDRVADATDGFGTLGTLASLQEGEYAVLGTDLGSCALNGATDPATAYDGDTADVIATGITLAPDASCAVGMTVRIFPTDARFADNFDNIASITGIGDLSGQTPSDQSQDGVDPDPNGDGVADESRITTVVPATSVSIALTKSGDISALVLPLQVGDLITYSFTVENTGDLTLTNVEIRDPLIQGEATPADPLIVIPVLEPGAANAVTETATYAITLADLNAGEVDNTADVTGTGPFGRTPADSATANTLLPQAPAVDLVKTATISGDQNPSQVGDVITYTFTITNTGNVTLTDVLLSDPLTGIMFDAANVNPIPVLEPGAANAVTMTATYAVTQDDINAGQVVNRASVTGSDPTGEDIIDSSGPLAQTDADTIQPLVRRPGLEATKTQVFVDNGDGVDSMGDEIRYTISVTNIGNVPVQGLVVNDTMTSLDGLSTLSLTTGPDFDSADAGSPEGTLAPGETATYLATYIIELDAVLGGGVSNTVTAIANAMDGSGPPDTPVAVSDRSDDGIDIDGNTTDDPTEFMLSPSIGESDLTIAKTTPATVVARGDIVPYEITVTNGGTYLQGEFDLTDRLPEGLSYLPGTATINGEPASVTYAAGVVTWPDVLVPPLGQTVVTLQARVLQSATGELVNHAILLDAATGEPVGDGASAVIRVPVDPIFECSDVIGKVFNDRNGNGYQDAPNSVERGISDQTYYGGKAEISPVYEETTDEPGIPSVRLATVDGTIITTDEHGRFSVPCAALPDRSGANFILKVDERSLPAGYRMTTENPRVMRVTRGALTEMNFGAAVNLPVVRIDLTFAVFGRSGDAIVMQPQLEAGLDALLQRIAGTPSTLMLTMHIAADADEGTTAQARRLLDMVEDQVRAKWRDVGRVRLRIEQNIARARQ